MTLNYIIPVYNNFSGLVKTISSILLIDQEICQTKITIINDCSTEDIDYNYIIQLFEPFLDIEIYNLPCNVGPGNARQYGLNHTTSDYVTFIDAGDIVYSPIEFNNYLRVVKNNPQAMMFSSAYIEERLNNEYETWDARSGRLHGKIYSINFIRRFNISFNPEGSYANEDIGFNAMCRYACAQLEYENPGYHANIIFEGVTVVWTLDFNSLTRQDDCAFYYKNNVGLSKNAIYAINNALHHNISLYNILYDAYETFVSTYIFHVSTMNTRPEFVEESLAGALYFYENFMIRHAIDQNLFLQAYNDTIQHYYSNGDPFCAKLPTINILEFLNMLEALHQERNTNGESSN